MTVFDEAAVRRLEADTGSREFVHSLVATYERMLDDRVQRIVDSLAKADVDGALDAAHSLRVSSIMTGLVETSEVATAITETLRAGELGAAREHSELLAAAAARASAALADYLDEDARAQESTDSIR